ncbi:uncharacterized protein LOC118433680 [Folsomia candida]|uniref:Uncharacterized protein n=1 Tax=Folsomia candida TaxID=158441 RepID=A0A226CV58_FOLCA|nr:uncharacterized protein LOC118433680 [Folsomia candida]OXA36883.1 hypothetical protein Fcan01_28359 [Folsomia candida]
MSDYNELKGQVESMSIFIATQQKELDSLKEAVGKNDIPQGQTPKDKGWSLGLSDEEDNSQEKESENFANMFQDKPHDGQDDNELVEIMKDIEGSIEYGPDLLPQISEGFSKTVSRPLTKETASKLKDQIKIPSNCKGFAVLKMNSEIWAHLPTGARLADIQTQQVQQSISFGLITMAEIANEVATHSNEIPQEVKKRILKLAIDGGNILGDQLQASNMKRRQEVKKLINPEYSAICNKQLPVSEYLFGDNLSETLKTSKAASTVIRSSMTRTTRFRPYNFSRNTGNLNFQRPFPRFQTHRGTQGQFRGQTRGQFNQRGFNRGNYPQRQFRQP